MITKYIFNKIRPLLVKEKEYVQTNRLKELKQLKQLANKYLSFYLERQNHSEKGWEKDLSTRNISILQGIINKLNKLQHDDKISEYLEAIRQIPQLTSISIDKEKHVALKTMSKNLSIILNQGVNIFFQLEINRCSPQLSYSKDLTWFKHGNLREHLDYGTGKVDETVFEKYLPHQLKGILETKKTFFSNEYFKDDLILLEATIPLIEKDKFIPANILIITLIEGVVRKFALLVYKKQNPDISNEAADHFAYMDNRSMEKLIKNSSWKKDIPLSFTEFVTEYSHTNNPIVTKFEEMIKRHKLASNRITNILCELKETLSQEIEKPILSDEELKEICSNQVKKLQDDMVCLIDVDKTVMIGIDVYLDFLVKKIKDDRNSIIHGKYSFFKEKWKTLVYLTALQTLIEKINWYENNVKYDIN